MGEAIAELENYAVLGDVARRLEQDPEDVRRKWHRRGLTAFRDPRDRRRILVARADLEWFLTPAPRRLDSKEAAMAG